MTERELQQARAIFDVRVWVSGVDEKEVYERVAEFARAAKLVAPIGIDVRYWQLRSPDRTKAFAANMRPSWARRKSA